MIDSEPVCQVELQRLFAEQIRFPAGTEMLAAITTRQLVPQRQTLRRDAQDVRVERRLGGPFTIDIELTVGQLVRQVQRAHRLSTKAVLIN